MTPRGARVGPTFLISPASLDGNRGGRLLAPGADGEWAARLAGGVEVGELFSAISSLYFRGKLAYGLHFGGVRRTRVIAPGVGLVSPRWRIDLEGARQMAAVRVRPDDARYRRPLERAVRRARSATEGDFVLLGSLATDRYSAVLKPLLGARLLAPAALFGRGSMQRGSLLLTAVRSDAELEYVEVP